MARFDVPSASPTESNASDRSRRSMSPTPEPPPKYTLNTPKPYVKKGRVYKVPSSSDSSSSSDTSPDRPAKKRVEFRTPSPDNNRFSRSPERHRFYHLTKRFSRTRENTPLAPGALKRPGSIGQNQEDLLLLVDERPLKRPRLSGPSSPGLDWQDGAAWWVVNDAGIDGERLLGREHISYDPSEQVVTQVQTLLSHPNLITMRDHDGFREEDVRNETLWEFMDAGTLNAVILNQRLFREFPMRKREQQGLPEGFIWHTVTSLLRALHYLHAGGVNTAEDNEQPGCQPIVHNALDPANIFFQHASDLDGEDEREYGKCKLGNFRHCVILPRIIYEASGMDEDEILDTHKAFSHILTNVNKEGETGFEAPELLLRPTRRGAPRHTPGPASDLWSLGATVIAMMTTRTIWDLVISTHFLHQARLRRHASSVMERWQDVGLVQRVEMLRRLAGKDTIVTFLPDGPGGYSVRLRRLVASLCSIDPEERLDAAEALREAVLGQREYLRTQTDESEDDDNEDDVYSQQMFDGSWYCRHRNSREY